MSYQLSYNRVAPRDLFNEANFLKCLGQLAMAIIDGHLPHIYFDEDTYSQVGTPLMQNEDGDLCLVYDLFKFKCDDDAILIFRPLNSREPWPIYTINEDGERVSLFDADGKITDQFRQFIVDYKVAYDESY